MTFVSLWLKYGIATIKERIDLLWLMAFWCFVAVAVTACQS